jgi:hypothetical protein
MARKRKSAWTKYVLAQLLAEPQNLQADQGRSGVMPSATDIGPEGDDKSKDWAPVH